MTLLDFLPIPKELMKYINEFVNFINFANIYFIFFLFILKLRWY